MEKQNVQQYVILGAGMDTFALRRTDTSSTLRIFELDHPATQSSKRQRISALGTMLPENLHFIPVDFTKEDLTDALKRSEYDPEVPAFFSWLGVTYYLPREVVLSVLSSISDLATAKSNIVFDYYNTDAFIEGKASRRMEGWKNFTRAAGEPIITGFDPSSLAEDIIGTGFSLKENLSPVDIEKLYFLGRSDNYHATEHTYFARAEIV
jgi:methyltransferase (TIGR00027 family)